MANSDSLPYEVGRGKPPREHQFKPGNKPKGHRRKGSLNIANRLREKLEQEVQGRDVQFVDVLVSKIASEALRNPIKYWPLLRDLLGVDEALAEHHAIVDGQVEDQSEGDAEKLRRLDAWLAGMPQEKRTMVVRVLFELEEHISGGAFVGAEAAGHGKLALPGGHDPHRA